MTTTTCTAADIRAAEYRAHSIAADMKLADERRAPDYGHGDWTTPRMTRMPIWHLAPGMLIEAKYDNRIAALGGDVTVVGAPQFDARNHSLMHLLVRCTATGELHTLSGYSDAAYHATVAPVDASIDAFNVHYFFANMDRSRD